MNKYLIFVSSTIYSTIKTNKMTITIITDKERALHLVSSRNGYYEIETFDPEVKVNADQVGLRIKFPEYYTTDMAALLLFHAGIRFGLDKGLETIKETYKPNAFKGISVDGRN